MKIIESEKKLNLTDIQDLESRLGINFPKDLTSLYLKFNGGIQENGDKILDTFYSIKFGENTLERVRDLIQVTENQIPLNYLIFGCTAFGNQIAINMDNGNIVLFRKDVLEPKVISDNFMNFMNQS